MSDISSSITLNDHVTEVLNRITQSLYSTISAFDEVDEASARAFADDIGSTVADSLVYYENELADVHERLEEVTNATNSTQSATNNLESAVKRVVGAYLGFQTVKEAISMSDEISSTRARIDNMNDGMQTTDELMDMIYQGAQRARSNYTDLADVVARFGNNAGNAFESSEEVVKFSTAVAEFMAQAGTGAQEAAAAELQLSQALGSGVLRGDELNSIFEQSPNIIQAIADYMDVDIGKIREMASEGMISAEVVKNAVLSSAGEMDEKLNNMPLTFEQIWTKFKNAATKAFFPVSEKINEIANSQAFQGFVVGAVSAVAIVANAINGLLDIISIIINAIYEGWAFIGPIFQIAAVGLGAYLTCIAIAAIQTGIAAAASIGHSIALGIQTAALALFGGMTWQAAAAQTGLNVAMAACPIVWIVAAVLMLIIVIYGVATAIAKATGVASTGLGVLAGCINVAIAFFQNLGIVGINIFRAIAAGASAVGNNIKTAFSQAISYAQGLFYDLLATASNVIASIAKALNSLPFVSFDYSGISSAASGYAKKSAAAYKAADEANYKDVGAEIDKAMSKGQNAFEGDWAGKAFKAGAKSGDGLAEGIAGALGGGFDPSKIMDDLNMDDLGASIPDYGSLGGTAGNVGDNIAGNTGKTAGNTADIAKAVNVSNENLEYIRDLAKKDAINRFTTAQISVNLGGVTNNVSGDTDLDGVVSYLARGVTEAISKIEEGVHA